MVRHGQVDFPGGIRRCIGWTDLPLDDRGRRQAGKLGDYFRHMKERPAAVFTSPLARAAETAKILAGDVMPVFAEEGLRELNMGEWENVPMNRLNKTLESWPQTGETREEGLGRIRKAVDGILERTEGDVVCVAHAGLNSCFLASLSGSPLNTSRSLPQPYGGLSLIRIDEKGNMEIEKLGVMTEEAPDDQECRYIWEHYHTPEHVRRHCQAVCREAERISRELARAGKIFSSQVVRGGALLHDMARTEPDHARRGASIARREGYPAVAEVIARHHDLECPDSKSLGEGVSPLWLETAVVYLADKYVKEDRVVSLEERFAASRRRCEQAHDRTAAMEAHDRRYRQAKAVENLIQREIDGGQTR